jgi:hypothetical protein
MFIILWFNSTVEMHHSWCSTYSIPHDMYNKYFKVSLFSFLLNERQENAIHVLIILPITMLNQHYFMIIYLFSHGKTSCIKICHLGPGLVNLYINRA